MAVIRDVEIFRVGHWNGDNHSVADLEDMVSAFRHSNIEIPVKIGHAEKNGIQVFGTVTAVRRVGEKLLADIDVTSQLYRMIRSHRFDYVSPEVFHDLQRNGKHYTRALKAIAIVGSETPAVAGLAPLREAIDA
jgi:hypothetical protein